MTKPGDLLAGFEKVADLRLGGGDVATFQQQLHHVLIRAAVQWSLERRDGGGDGGVHVREGCGRHAGGKRAGVHPVFGVQHQRGIHHTRQRFVRPLSAHHVQEVCRERHRRIRVDRLEIVSDAMKRRDDRRQLRRQSKGLAFVGFR